MTGAHGTDDDDARRRPVGDATRARFRRVDALLDAALDRPPAERAAFLDAATAGDAALRVAVEALLAAEADPGGFLDDVARPDALQAHLARGLEGRYRLLRRLGSGGMAHVYLADEPRHGRQVAIKAIASGDPSQVEARPAPGDAARFLAEIRVMARLQHPHLLPLLDSGDAAGVPYLVMPYVDGGTLRDRMARDGALPIAEAVRLARAIAGALAHAHAAGIVHRDLKPENVLLRDGEPLVADFGIALAAAATRMTAPGMAIGTPQYMAPEQVTGDGAIDARTDVYALGALTYEMLAGEPPHVAATARGVLVKVLSSVPVPLRAMRPEVPAALSDAVARALATQPADRFASATAFGAALAESLAPAPVHEGAPPVTTRAKAGPVRPRRALFVGGALVAALALAAAGIAAWRGGAPGDDAGTTSRALRFVVQPVPEAAIGRAPTLTPDGASLVYAGAAAVQRRVFVRPVTSLAARALPGTTGALSVAVSPDGLAVAVVTDEDALLRVPLDGGTPTRIGDAFRYSTLAWAGPTRIVLDGYGSEGLVWRSADGGPEHPLTRIDRARRDATHDAPVVHPDGRTVVFVIRRDIGGPAVDPAGRLAVATLDTTGRAPAPYVELDVAARRPVGWLDDHLLYLAPDGAHLVAHRFDPATRRLVGSPVPVLDDPAGEIAVATLGDDGTLLYTRQRPLTEFVWVDTAGRAVPVFADRAGRYMNPRLAPDGRRLVAQTTTREGNDAWVFDLDGGTATRVTHTGGALNPTWTRDGRHLVFFSTLGGRTSLWRVASDGRAPPERLLDASGLFAPDVAPDGRTIVFQRTIEGAWSLWTTTLDDRGTASAPQRIPTGAGSAFMPAISPDGRWLAYAANATGRHEIRVRALAGGAAEVQVSRDGGTEPAWSPDGRRLYWRGARRLQVADVGAVQGALPAFGAPRTRFVDAFDGDMPMPHRNYDIERGGDRFLMIGGSPSGTAETVVVVGWREEARARLRAAR